MIHHHERLQLQLGHVCGSSTGQHDSGGHHGQCHRGRSASKSHTEADCAYCILHEMRICIGKSWTAARRHMSCVMLSCHVTAERLLLCLHVSPPCVHAVISHDSHSVFCRVYAEYKRYAKSILKSLKSTSASRCTIEAGPYHYHYLIESGVVYLTLVEKGAIPRKLVFQVSEHTLMCTCGRRCMQSSHCLDSVVSCCMLTVRQRLLQLSRALSSHSCFCTCTSLYFCATLQYLEDVQREFQAQHGAEVMRFR